MKILVNAFQSLSHVALDATGLTVLVGPSNRGKSALIRAIQGALFNLGGSYFVRKGSSSTQVALDEVPTAEGGGFLSLEWRKGKATNEYTVDGEEYKRIGKGAPAPIVEAGYRDVWIGDKDRKNGEYIRPQVHGQFDTVFLLGRSPAFIADVLSTIQRRAVITRAQDRCASDLRNVKRAVDIRSDDLAAAEAKSAVFDPVAGLVSRQATLERDVVWASSQLAMVTGGLTLAARCRDLRVLIGQLQQRVRALRAIEHEWVKLQTVHGWAQGISEAVEGRRRALAMTGMTMPPPVSPDVPQLDATMARAAAIAGALTNHRRAASVTTLVVPRSEVAPVMVSLDHWAAKAEQLRLQIAQLDLAQRMVYDHQRIVRATAESHDEVLANYDTLRDEAKVCPICERPFHDVPASATT